MKTCFFVPSPVHRCSHPLYRQAGYMGPYPPLENDIPARMAKAGGEKFRLCTIFQQKIEFVGKIIGCVQKSVVPSDKTTPFLPIIVMITAVIWP